MPARKGSDNVDDHYQTYKWSSTIVIYDSRVVIKAIS